ncbi:MAG TPA: tetratricopeptide repeat protein [bacterium]|nr:tetratricopeptide repeat protein [bacterium]
MRRRLIQGGLIAGLVITLFLSLSCAQARKGNKIAETKKEKVTSGHYEKGRTFLKEGFIIDAIREFKKAIKENPDNLKAHYYLAFSYKEKKYPGLAIEEFEEVVRINPGITEAHYQLGGLYVVSGLNEKAILAYEKVLELKPEHEKKAGIKATLFTLNYNLGVTHYNNGEYAPARENFQKVLKIKPEEERIKELLEKTNEILGVTKPRPVVTTGKAKDLLDRGVKYYNFGQYKAAIREFQKAIEREPQSLDAHLYLAYAYEKQGEKEKAIGEYQKITEIDPNHLDAHYQLGVYYDRTGKKDEAIKEYEKVLSLKPSKEKLEKISPVLYAFYYGQGIKSYNKKKYQEAKESFQEALKVKPGDSHATEMLSTVKMLLEEKGKE